MIPLSAVFSFAMPVSRKRYEDLKRRLDLVEGRVRALEAKPPSISAIGPRLQVEGNWFNAENAIKAEGGNISPLEAP